MSEWDTKLEQLAEEALQELLCNKKLNLVLITELLNPSLRFKKRLKELIVAIDKIIYSEAMTQKEIVTVCREAIGIVNETYPSLHGLVAAIQNTRYAIAEDKADPNQTELFSTE